METKNIELKKVEALTEKELQKLLGGGNPEKVRCKHNADSGDCTSELVSGGTTTDTE